MLQEGLFLSLRNSLDLDSFTKKQSRSIFRYCFLYFLGLIQYKNIFSFLKEFGVHYEFSRLVKSLSSKDLEYILCRFRVYTYSVYINSSELDLGINQVDKKWIKRLKDLAKFPISISPFPKEEFVICSMMPTIKKESINLKVEFSNTCFLDVDDIVLDMILKIMKTYRLYIFSFNKKSFNEKMLYRCLHNSVDTWKKDFIRRINSSPKIVPDCEILDTIPSDYEDGESFLISKDSSKFMGLSPIL